MATIDLAYALIITLSLAAFIYGLVKDAPIVLLLSGLLLLFVSWDFEITVINYFLKGLSMFALVYGTTELFR